MSTCDVISRAFARIVPCDETLLGTRFLTHCLYPSFEQVAVFVRRSSDHGYMVTDGGEAIGKAWLHGRDFQQTRRACKKAAEHFGCLFENDEICLVAPTEDWLLQAVIAVANAAAEAANEAIEKVAASTEQKLVTRIQSTVEKSPVGFEAKLEYKTVGKSGKLHRFDLLVKHQDINILIDVVVPFHTSIAAKYLAFSDTPQEAKLWKYAVFDRELAQDDKSLLSNVADLLPFESVVTTEGRALLLH